VPSVRTSGALSPGCEPTYGRLNVSVDGVDLQIATVYRGGDLAPIVFMHGFGSTKEDYVDAAHETALARHPFLAFDAPGCGQTICADLSKVSIPFAVATAQAVLEREGVERFHVVGHSMGGLTALLLAQHEPARVISFVSIEGNLAPEDCILSRQVITHSSDDDERFFDDFIERTRRSPSHASALYASGLRAKVRASAVRPILRSLVDLSDRADLIPAFLSLSCQRLFVYGAQNSGLSYLQRLAAAGVQLAAIPHSGHFPMYSNAAAMWERIAAFFTASNLDDAPGRRASGP
jgi:pimeloyl-ACP methyl ester carboxylesterase